MSTRDYAVSVLASLSEQKMREFIKLFADETTLENFEAEEDPFYSESNMKHLNKIIKSIEDGTAKLTEHELLR